MNSIPPKKRYNDKFQEGRMKHQSLISSIKIRRTHFNQVIKRTILLLRYLGILTYQITPLIAMLRKNGVSLFTFRHECAPHPMRLKGDSSL